MTIFNGRSGLGSVVHNCENSISIFHGKGRVDGIEIGCHIFIRCQVVFSDIPCWSVVQDSLLHFQLIRIGVEGHIVIKIGKLEIGGDFMTISGNWRQTSKINNEFQDIEVRVN